MRRAAGRRRWLRAGFALGALALAGGCERPRTIFASVDITGAGYGTTLPLLRDPGGRSVGFADFRGRVVAVFFGFTNCPDVCPTTLAKLKEVKTLLRADGDRFTAIFVTIDPEQDSAELLGAYVAAFDPAFVGLRGDDTVTRAVASDFKVYFEKVPTGPGTYTMSHSTGTFLFDTLGRARLYSRHEDPPALLVGDVRALLAERSR